MHWFPQQAKKRTNNSDDQLVMEQRWNIDHIITFSSVLCSSLWHIETLKTTAHYLLVACVIRNCCGLQTILDTRWVDCLLVASLSNLHFSFHWLVKAEVSEENNFYLSRSLVCFQRDGNTQLLQVQGSTWQIECHWLSLEFDNGSFLPLVRVSFYMWVLNLSSLNTDHF